MARRKRDEFRRNAAQLLLGCGMLQGVPPLKMTELYIEAVVAEEKKRLIKGGCSEEAAEKLCQDAVASERNYRRDSYELRGGVLRGKAKAGEALVLRRIEELELLRQQVRALRAECWRQFELGADDVGTEDRTEVNEPVDVEDPGKIDETTGEPSRRTVLRPQRVTNRYGSRTAARASNSVWVEKMLACLREENEYAEKIFKLCAALDLPPELPADLQALVARGDAAAAYAMQQAEHLGRALTRATGPPDRALMRLIMAALGKLNPEGPPNGGGQVEEEPGLKFVIIDAKATEVPS